MADSSKINRRSTARFLFAFILVISVTAILTAQSKSGRKSAQDPSQNKVSSNTVQAKPNEPPGVLIQLNGALETLAARVSPAVVQILVTGYGPLRESDQDKSQTAFIVRQHAVGSGV